MLTSLQGENPYKHSVNLIIHKVACYYYGMAGWLSCILDGLWPANCVGCTRAGSWWCDECSGRVLRVVSPICPGCRRLTPQGQYCSRCRPHVALTGIIAGSTYREPLTAAVKALKYRHASVVAPLLAKYPSDTLSRHRQRFDCLIPVPLHPSRKRTRGHNQAELLAHAIHKQTGLPLEDSLHRTSVTPSQTGLNRAERQRNVAGAFAWKGRSLQGCSVLLVDDVSTTGATLNACAAELRKAGARQVWGVVVGIR